MPADTVLSWALQSLRSAIAESGAEISCERPPAVRLIRPSSHSFQNLLANAIEYRRRDEAPRIHVVSVLRPRDD